MLTNLKPLEKRPAGEGLSLSDVPASNPAPLAVLGHYPDPGQRLRQPPCARQQRQSCQRTRLATTTSKRREQTPAAVNRGLSAPRAKSQRQTWGRYNSL